MAHEDSFYESADFFLTRFTLFPFSYQEFTPESLFDFYKNCPLFQEAIAIASPNLFQSLKKKTIETKAYLSLLKYYIRMSSRATPFGLFSAVSWGEFKEKGDLSFHSSSICKKVKPDMAWGQMLIDYIHSQREVVRHLRVMTNPNLTKKMGRVFLSKEVDSCSIKSSKASDCIFYQAKYPLPYSDLECQLLAAFPQQSPEIVADYLWQIFQKGYLLSECSVSLDHPFSLKGLFQKLQKTPFDLAWLNKMECLINRYEEEKLGEGLFALKELREGLDAWKKVDYPVQVDAYRESGFFLLPEQMKGTIGEVASWLWLFSNEEFNPLQEYCGQFQEKYGQNRLVPVLELLNDHQGLGFPALALPKKKGGTSWGWEQVLLSSIGTQEIRLDKLPILSMDKEKLEKAPFSLEIGFELLASSQEALDGGDYQLIINPYLGSTQAGKIFGRFLYLFDSSQVEQLRTFMEKEGDLYPQALFVEAGFCPQASRAINVSFHEKIRQFELKLHFHERSEHTLDLEDIYVGYRRGSLYLFSKKWGKELHVSLSSAINQEYAPPILRFLLNVSQSLSTSFHMSIWGAALDRPFLPRVSYKQVVLSPARWLLNPKTLGLKDRWTPKEAEKAIGDSFHTLKIPAQIYLTNKDNRLLLSWENRDHFQLILQHFAKTKEILLYEAIGREKELPVRSEQGGHITEFIVPCMKKKAYQRDLLPHPYPSTDQIAPADRLHLPGGEWLFIKLFVAREEQESFLHKQLLPLVQQLLGHRWVDQWFYVRYQDEKPSIRLRFKGHPEELYQQALPFIHKHFSQWIFEGLLAHFSFCPYEREIERYGGPDRIELAEKIFALDSMACLSILENKEKSGLPLHILSAFGIINFLQSFYPREETAPLFLPSDKHLLSGFRPYTQKALELGAFLFNSDSSSPYLFWKEQLDAIRVLIGQFDVSAIQPWNQKESIVESFIHMHCNRLLGNDRKIEKKAIAIATHLLEKMNYHRKILCNQP